MQSHMNNTFSTILIKKLYHSYNHIFYRFMWDLRLSVGTPYHRTSLFSSSFFPPLIWYQRLPSFFTTLAPLWGIMFLQNSCYIVLHYHPLHLLYITKTKKTLGHQKYLLHLLRVPGFHLYMYQLCFLHSSKRALFQSDVLSLSYVAMAIVPYVPLLFQTLLIFLHKYPLYNWTTDLLFKCRKSIIVNILL